MKNKSQTTKNQKEDPDVSNPIIRGMREHLVAGKIKGCEILTVTKYYDTYFLKILYGSRLIESTGGSLAVAFTHALKTAFPDWKTYDHKTCTTKQELIPNE